MKQTNTARTIAELVEKSAHQRDKHPAIVDETHQLSFLDLYEQSCRAARAMIANNINKGDRVAIWSPNIWEWIVAALGVESVGGILVPLNTRFKGSEAAWILNRCQPKLLFTVKGFLDIDYMDMLNTQKLSHKPNYVLMRGEDPGALVWDDFMAMGDNVSEDERKARVAMVDAQTQLDLLFTSGTTGNPKGVCTAHHQNIKVYDIWSNTVGLTQNDRYLIVNPFFHSFGYKAGWLAAMIRGCTIYPMAQFDVDKTLQCIAQEKISMLPGPPAIFQSILMHPNWQKYDLSSLRLAVTGAASVPVKLIERMRSDLQFENVVTAYGLTESTGVVSICQPDDSAERIANTAGRAMPGVELRCVDQDQQDVPLGEAGELLVRGYNVMSGYYDDAEATAATIDSDGWLRTGDVAVMDELGYIRITDRIKDVYICGGFNCYPAEVENMLCNIEGVTQAAVIGMPDERLGEVGRAFLVLDARTQLDEKTVIQWCRDHMANYKVPRSVIFLEHLPINAAGKVLKTELRGQHPHH